MPLNDYQYQYWRDPKFASSWYGRIANSFYVPFDTILDSYSVLNIKNRKGTHYLAVQGAMPLPNGELIRIYEYPYNHREILAITCEDSVQFERVQGERPWAYNLHHDLHDEWCKGGTGCTDPAHWFTMTPLARELMLETNPGYQTYLSETGDRVWMPSDIPGGFSYWEYQAEQARKVSNG